MLPAIRAESNATRLASAPETTSRNTNEFGRLKTPDRTSALKPKSAGGTRSKSATGTSTKHVAFPGIHKDLRDGNSPDRQAAAAGAFPEAIAAPEEGLHRRSSSSHSHQQDRQVESRGSSRGSRAGTSNALKGLFKFSVQDFVRSRDAKMGVIPMYLQERKKDSRPGSSASSRANSRVSSAGRRDTSRPESGG
jgi:hypothetical protein